MMVACLQSWGMSPLRNESLKVVNNSSRAFGPSAFRKDGGMSSGPGAPLGFIALMAFFSSVRVMGAQLMSLL